MKLLRNLRNKNLQACAEMDDRFKDQNEKSSDWNDKTVTQLHSIQERIEKFLLEDIRRDTPTGKYPSLIQRPIYKRFTGLRQIYNGRIDLTSILLFSGLTPARKEYRYPRYLAATSPHERIIQRFREAKNHVDNMSDGEVNI